VRQTVGWASAHQFFETESLLECHSARFKYFSEDISASFRPYNTRIKQECQQLSPKTWQYVDYPCLYAPSALKRAAADLYGCGLVYVVSELSWGPWDHQSPLIRLVQDNGDYFGMIAKTRLPLSAGKWEFAALSDDGIRLTVDGRAIIDNWTWHGPTPDTATFELQTAKTVEITVEHFEIDGYAVLEMKVSSQH